MALAADEKKRVPASRRDPLLIEVRCALLLSHFRTFALSYFRTFPQWLSREPYPSPVGRSGGLYEAPSFTASERLWVP
jgi:hypothetical protein